MHTKTINKIYKAGFFIILGLFFSLFILIVVAVKSDKSPLGLIKSISLRKKQNFERVVVPTSYFKEQSWINEITPNGNRILDLVDNSNCVTIQFSQDMDINFIETHSFSFYTENGHLDFAKVLWIDSRTLTLTLNRTPQVKENIFIEYSFKNINGYILPKLVLNYE